jgi:hypothetical protein
MDHFNLAQLYRQQAAYCRREAAASVTPPELREHWFSLAAKYDELAHTEMKLTTIETGTG